MLRDRTPQDRLADTLLAAYQLSGCDEIALLFVSSDPRRAVGMRAWVGRRPDAPHPELLVTPVDKSQLPADTLTLLAEAWPAARGQSEHASTGRSTAGRNFALVSEPRRDDGCCAILGLRAGPDTPFNSAELAQLSNVGTICWTQLRLQEQLQEQYSLVSTLNDRIGIAMLALDARRQVHYANRAARALLRAGDGLRLADGRLQGHNAVVERQLSDLVSLGSPDSGGIRAAGISRPSGAPAYAVFAVPAVPAGQREAIALIYLIDPAIESPIDRAALKVVLDLTATEAQVLGQLCDGDSIDSVAQVLGKQVGTVRVHLRNMYRKLGVRSHALLMRRAFCAVARAQPTAVPEL